MTPPGANKAPDALRTIGEVAAETGVAPHILRYWEAHVPALRPVRRAGGRRYFRVADVALIRRLDALVTDQGYTLEGAARALQGGGAAPVADHGTPAPTTSALGNDAMLSHHLQRIRSKLQAAIDRADC